MATSRQENLHREDVLVDGTRLRVLGGGPATTDEAVVLLHGNPGSGEHWADLMAQLAPAARVLAPDMPGFGHSERAAAGAETFPAHAALLGRLLDEQGVRRAHLVLHDLGGPWGLTWAAEHPERVASITLVDTGVLRGYGWHVLARLWRTPLLGEALMAATTRPALGLLLRPGNPRGLPRQFVDRLAGDLSPRTRPAVLALYRATSDPAGDAERLHAALRGLDCPVLVVWGAADPYVGVHHAQQQRETFPQARVVVLERSGHWPYADDPTGTADVVVPFLRAARTG